MTIKQLILRKKELEDALRRYGIEGEQAFSVVAFHYVIHHRDSIHNPSERLLKGGEKAFKRVQHDPYVVTFLNSVVSGDPAGENLPTWYQYFLGRKFREGSGKFFTPRPIARAMAALISRKEGAVIMDPTCGGGTFLIEASKRWDQQTCHLVGNDIEPSLVGLASLVLELGTPRHHTKSFLVSNIYEPDAPFQEWYGKVDYILANPPFSLHINSLDVESGLFALGYRNSDALFLDICFRLLRDQGRLVCLLPHSIIANVDFQKLRSAVEESWDLLGVIGMPEGVFHLTASTTTRADIVILRKRVGKQNRASTTVFAFAPTVGIPLNRRMKDPGVNYLDEIVTNQEVMKALGVT